MSEGSCGRYAVYYAPEEGSELHEFGKRWLGRNAITGAIVKQYSIPDFNSARLRQITEAARHYGFHGTLKAPFCLADGTPFEELLLAARNLSAVLSSFSLRSLELKWLGRFLALVPSEVSNQLCDLAAVCVRHFDAFRAPLSIEELARRRCPRLTPRQEELLERWGYPYVMEEFRFYLTLTGPMEDEVERDSIWVAAEPLTRSLRNRPLWISSFCIFQQPRLTAPFRLTHRLRFKG